MKSERGEVTLIVLAALLVVGGAWVAFPKLFPGASKRAAQSTATTAKVDAAIIKVDDTAFKQAAFASASVAKLGEAVSFLPDSPATSFLRREIPFAQSLLPPPDPTALIEAHKRLVAALEKDLAKTEMLYGKAMEGAASLQRERDAALAERDAAQAARRKVDLDLEKAAAAERAQMLQKFAFIGVAVVAVGGWIFIKFYSISPATMGRIAADVRAGVPPIQAFDANTPPRIHKAVQKAAKLATDIKPGG